MSAPEAHNANGAATVGRADMHLEVEIIPVCDVDGAKEFYERLGFRLDDDVAPAGGPFASSSSHPRGPARRPPRSGGRGNAATTDRSETEREPTLMSDDGTPINGAVALVTDGHRGFGRATVDELLDRGAAKVYATPRTATWLLGRRSERAALDGLVAAVRAGESRALVVQGEPGVGKSALLDYVAGQAAACRVVRATGVESEMELAFAGLHQLCAPLLGLLGRLPVPQGDALATAFGLRTGEAPDRFLVSLAVLHLFGEAAEERPLVCLVDDAQWLDRASAQVLGFVARRLVAESVGLIFVSRQPSEDSELKDLRELVVEGLPYGDARVLLESVVAGP